MNPHAHEDDTVHFLKNQLSIVLGFTALLMEQLEEGHPMREDLDEIQMAAQAALSRIPELSSRLSRV